MTCTPVDSFIGGLLLFSSAFSLMKNSGQILGFSGVLSISVNPWTNAYPFTTPKLLFYFRRVILVVGHILGAVLLREHWPQAFSYVTIYNDMWVYGLLGAAMGIVSAKLSCGCTSGHMIVGLSRFGPRSLVATLLFFIVAMPVSLWSSSDVIAPRLPGQDYFYIPSNRELGVMLGSLAAAAVSFFSIALFAHVAKDKFPSRYLLISEVLLFLNNFLCGFFAALGLGFARMTDPIKVLSFLNLRANWDPSLMFIVLGCLVPLTICYHLFVKPTGSAILDPLAKTNQVPKKFDWKLFVGSPLFGLTWGLTGYCPGTVFTVWPTMFAPATSFVGGLLLGFIAGDLFTFVLGKVVKKPALPV